MSYGKTLIVLAGSLALGTGVVLFSAKAAANPYQAISERNVFGLKDPPPPPDPETLKPEPPKITLTGITTIFGPPQALMTTPPPAPKPGQPAQAAQSFRLGIGQREGDIEVLAIDEKAGSVRVKNGGREATLTFDKDGPKIASGPAPGAPGAPGSPGAPGGIRPPATSPANPFMPSAVPGTKQVPNPTRSLRLPSGAGFASPAAGGSAAVPTYNPGYAAPGYAAGTTTPTMSQPGQTVQAGQTAVPVSGLFSSPTQNKQPNWPPERYDLSREEQAALLLVQRETFKNNPNAPPFPPLPGEPAQTPATPTTQDANQNTGNSGYQPLPGMPLAPGQTPF